MTIELLDEVKDDLVAGYHFYEDQSARLGSYFLFIPRPDKPMNNAIDHFLFSLAKDQGRASIGIILSGEGSDGTKGLKILKEKGGVTFAQTHSTDA